MAQAISRRKIAQYAAKQITAGKTEASIQEIAAYLVQTGREREADLIVRDIEMQLASSGTVLAKVTTAHPLSAQLRQSVQALIAAHTVYINEVIDPTILGGIRVELPGKQFDGTLRHKLTMLNELTLN